MIHREAEARVKALQKEFLLWLEENIENVNAPDFEQLRRKIFRGSFNAFRLGVVGLAPRLEHADYPYTGYLTLFVGGGIFIPKLHPELPERYFRMALEAFRLGTLVGAHKEPELHEIYNS